MRFNRITALTIAICSLFVALLASGCATDYVEEMTAPPARFKLANGSPISEAAYDDYNPILLQLSNGYLALVFASTRACASCTGHNVFIASSVSTYAGDGKLPAFNAPQVVTANSAVLNFTTRLRLAGIASGNNINVFMKDSSMNISNTGMQNPVSAVPINIPGSLPTIANYYCYAGTLLGLDAAGLMISTVLPSGPISRYNPGGSDMCPVNTFSNTGMVSAVNISVVRASEIGIAEGFLVTDSTGKLTAQTATKSGPVIQNFADTLTQNSLFLTSATAFKANVPAGDLLVFSAAPGAGLNSDMYIIANKTPSALWLKYVPYGTQPQP